MAIGAWHIVKEAKNKGEEKLLQLFSRPIQTLTFF